MTIAEASGPFDTGTFLEDGWVKLFSMGLHDGVRTTSDLSGSISGATILLTQGRAVVQGVFYEMTGSIGETKTITPAVNGSGNPRIDLIVLRLNRSTNTVVQAVLAGTPAASPVAPTPTQVEGGIWEYPIWQYQFSSAGAISALTDLRYVEQGAWQPWTATFTSGLTVGNGTSVGAYTVDQQRLVTVRWALTLGSTSSVSAPRLQFPLPIAAGYIQDQVLNGSVEYFDTSATTRYLGAIAVNSTSAGGLGDTLLITSPSGLVSSTAPFTWATGDKLSVGYSYEAATG